MKSKLFAFFYTLVVSQLLPAITQADGNSSQTAVLKLFAKSFASSPSVALSTWLTDNPCDGSWSGIVCSGSGVVQTLDLNGNWLKGSIPAVVGQLVGLQSLFLYNNYLSGSIPPELGKLVSTKQIWLHNNGLTGSIPLELGNLKSCKELTLFGNMLSGDIPASLSTIQSLILTPGNSFCSTSPGVICTSNVNTNTTSPPPVKIYYSPPLVSPPPSVPDSAGPSGSPANSPETSPALGSPSSHVDSPEPWAYSPPMVYVSYGSPPSDGPAISPAESDSPPALSSCNLKASCPAGESVGVPPSCSCVNATSISLRFTQLSMANYTIAEEDEILQLVASLLSVDVDQVRVVSRRQGSVILDMDILPANGTSFSADQVSHFMSQLNSGSNSFPSNYSYSVLSPAPASGSSSNILIAVMVGVLGGFLLLVLCLLGAFCLLRKKHMIKDESTAVISPDSSKGSKKSNSTGGVDVTDKTWPETPRKSGIFSLWSHGSLGLNKTPKATKTVDGTQPGVTDSGVKRLEEGSKKSSSPLQNMSRKVLAFAFPRIQKKDDVPAEKVQVQQLSGGSESNCSNELGRVDAFSLRMIQGATKDFHKANLIGERSYGRLYKANLSAGEKAIVAVLSGEKIDTVEFLKHAQMLSSVKSSALVPLIGYSGERGQRILLFSYMPNGSLSDHLHGEQRIGRQLNWHRRVRIARDVAEGLTYMHDAVQPPMIHRDLQAANVLLDHAFHAKLVDYGMSSLFHTGVKSGGSSGVLDSIPYQAPEYRSTGIVSEKSDVFSFGVLLLELFTGRKPVDSSRPKGQQNLIYWVLPHAESRRALQSMVDPHLRLNSSLDPRTLQRFVILAKQCLQPKPETRPPMASVLRELHQLISEDSTAENSQHSNGNTTATRVYQSGTFEPTIEEEEHAVEDSDTVTTAAGEEADADTNTAAAKSMPPVPPAGSKPEILPAAAVAAAPQAGSPAVPAPIPAESVEEWDRIREVSKQYPLGLEGWEAVRKSVQTSADFAK